MQNVKIFEKKEEWLINKVILMGRLTRDPDIRYSSGDNSIAIARYTLAVDRKFKRDGDPAADFIGCMTFGKSAQFAEKYFKQGMKIAVTGRIQTRSYTNKDGQKIYTTDVIVEDQEFCEGKQNTNTNNEVATSTSPTPSKDGFMNIPDGIDEELPFN